MKKSRFTPEQVVQALRLAEGGTVVGEICGKLGVTEATFYRRRKQYAFLDVVERRELRVRTRSCDRWSPISCSRRRS